MASKKLTAEQQALFDVLTPLQKRFVTFLLKGKSQVDAYRKAGGKAKGDSAHSKATQIVRNSKVESFLSSVQYEAVSSAIMTYEEAMERLTAMGRTSIADLATFGTHVVGEDDDGSPISQSVWSFKNASELKPEQMAAISELTAGKDGLKIKLHDPKAAIKQLAEMRGWEAPKKTEVTATVKSENVNMTPDEAAEAYKKLMG
ncbi:terminase small subunit [Pectobacterium aroidearum]|uniref:terminase small subunit n=1 Tax=Pectobacterium aroidearum TaxID=1201031 RepID=UPI0015F5366C|nr:terminase small subunit [Pectobacterium aroidearum]MBA5601038.1 terminase small subunit [Pectobacterium aroidearum]